MSLHGQGADHSGHAVARDAAEERVRSGSELDAQHLGAAVERRGRADHCAVGALLDRQVVGQGRFVGEGDLDRAGVRGQSLLRVRQLTARVGGDRLLAAGGCPAAGSSPAARARGATTCWSRSRWRPKPQTMSCCSSRRRQDPKRAPSAPVRGMQASGFWWTLEISCSAQLVVAVSACSPRRY